LISTGVYKFPKNEALRIALSAIQEFLLAHDMEVTVAVFDKGSFELSGKLFAGIDEYIDEHYVADAVDSEYRGGNMRSRVRGYENERVEELRAKKMSLDDVLKRRSESFSEMLFRLIDERGLKDPEVYTGANVTKQAFSTIRCKPDYQPKKKTALAFAVSLKLDMNTARELLASAGYAFSPSDKTDLIVQFFINNKNYSIIDINIALDENNLPIL
ncbi:MAG: RNase III inhibitor, partial [Ruminiclostridium sp.]|nr:RNase III inhibitor [Ruminiclostridium sp.]